jgi:death-on-curing protein
MHSILRNHALVDGNKRLAWLATATFLEINGISVLSVTNEAVYDLVLSAATTDEGAEPIATELRRICRA